MALHDAVLEELGLAPRWVRRGMGGADAAQQAGTQGEAHAAVADVSGMTAGVAAIEAADKANVAMSDDATAVTAANANPAHGRDAMPSRTARPAAEPVADASTRARSSGAPAAGVAGDMLSQRGASSQQQPAAAAAPRDAFDASSGTASDRTADAPDEDMSWFDEAAAPAMDDASFPLANDASDAPVPARAQIATLGWDDLASRVAGCHACGLCEKRTNTVFGVGDREAEWMLIGEAPGENEDRQGEPFVGQAGKLLDNMLKSLALARGENVYIANVIKCRPPGNRNPEPDEVARCEPYLQRQVALVKPKLIVAMGRFAAQSLLRTDQSISALRGRVHEYEGVPVIVTYHPAYLLRSLPDKAKAWADLCLARSTWQNAAHGQDA